MKRRYIPKSTREKLNLFNPRRDKWDEHFLLTEAQIIPKTEIGEASIKIFQLNHPNRMIERLALIDEGLW
jgi:hypothetical protein